MATTKFKLYDGEVEMTFNPDAPRYRYLVSDRRLGTREKPMRGVTTLMRDVIHKPDLLMWPMNEALNLLFNQQFDDASKSYFYKKSKNALLQPEVAYTAEQLSSMLQEARGAHSKKSDRGKDVGTLVHAQVETYLRNQIQGAAPLPQPELDENLPPEDIKAVRLAFQAFVGWWESLRDKQVLMVEAPLYSRNLQFSGTCDLVAKINGKVYMLDIKTTNRSRVAPMGIYAEYFLQLGAYSYAVREERGTKFADVGIINVGKDGTLHVATAVDMGLTVDACERAFAFATRLHDWLQTTSKLTGDSRFTSHLNPTVTVEPQSATNK